MIFKYLLMYKARFFIYLLLLILSGFSCQHNVGTNPDLSQAEATFQQLLEEAVYSSFESVPGVSMTVTVPDLDINWTGATGFDSKKKTQELKATQPFRIASATKTFVGAAILRLHEMGKLSIDDPIADYISETHITLLKKGGYAPDSITVRHCLNHTSGLYDYALGGKTYLEMAAKDSKKRWTRTEQIKLAMESGNRKGNPGEKYSYGDTGYILLGEAIEVLTDTTLAFGLRNLLGFDQLKMTSTWLESLEPAPKGLEDFVHRYLRGNDYTDWDPSIDLYGGGGLVSTTVDLNVFLQSLFNHQVFKNENTLKLMLEKPVYAATYLPDDDERFKDYRQGLWEISIYGQKAYMHGGIWGTLMLHVPEMNCTVTINYTHGKVDRLLKKTLLVVKNLHDIN